jgi:glycosyltransferase involved in cell wall biosynthesis
LEKPILFISHDASQTGAPILLFNLAKLLVESRSCRIDFLLKRKGVLENDFKTLGHVDILSVPSKTYTGKIIRKLRRVDLKRKLKNQIGKYEFVLSNTIINGDIHELLDGANVFTYVHELPFSIQAATTEQDVKKVVSHTRTFLFPSLAVREHLQRSYKINPQNLVYLPYYIIDHFSKKTAVREETRNRLKVDPDTFIVGCMGTPGWRKGSDVFLQVAKKAAQQIPLVKFVWCGGTPGNKEWLAMELEITNMGLEGNVILLPSTGDSWQVMAAFDVFFLSSREDPYPLVVIEAAMMGLPVICFDKSGGSVEFIENDCGYIVEYLDVDNVVVAVKTLYADNALYTMFSEAARRKYVQRHSKEVVQKAFLSIMTP